MFKKINEENLLYKLKAKIKRSYRQFEMPKLLVHGLNDKVTATKEITKLVDQRTTLLVYSGDEGTHDLKGNGLNSASRHIQYWVTSTR